jgi:hypothetical protein
MYKVLIVGLGGSGGKTLSFLMDELKVRLGDSWDGRLPESWKFIHIDVPAVADGVGSNLASPVAEQGGRYVGIAGRTATYSTFDKAAMSALKNQDPSALDLAARWRPDPKRASAIAVAGGAGAFRAVGRVVTLAGASNIYSTLKSAINDLSTEESTADHNKLARQLGAPAGSDGVPLVLLVSSLAGGSGASMVLDVADMLRGLSTETFDGQHSAAFLYTADVFASLGIASAGPGSLATISELVSALGRQGEKWTSREWEALGIANAAVPGPSIDGRGPLVVFPVGAKSKGTPFGNSPEDVYRGFARMLAPLFMDHKIQIDFHAYVQTNFLSDLSKSGDTTGLAKRRNHPTNIAHFSAWGSAVLSMGRKRYSEYAAQRVARRASEILVNGFQDQDFLDKKINLQQAITRYVDALYPMFLDVAKLNMVAGNPVPDSGKLLEAVVPSSVRQSFANAKSIELGASIKGDGPTAASNITNYLKRNLDPIKSEATSESLRTIAAWTQSVQTDVEDAFLHIASIKGLRVAIGCLDRLASDLGAVQLDLDTKVSANPPALEKNISVGLASIRSQKNQVQVAGQAATQFLGNYAQQLKIVFGIEAAKLLSPVIGDFSKNFIQPLKASAESVFSELDLELRKTAKNVVTAAYREAPVALWPGEDGAVPGHFQPAINEVLIDGTDEFPAFFDAHLAQAVSPVVSGMINEAARQILTRYRLERKPDGNFEPVVGWVLNRTALGSHPNVERTNEWQPRELSPATGRTQSQASFDLKLDWRAILTHSRSWVDLPSCPFRQHSDQGISSWLNPEETISQQEKDRRRDVLVDKFKQTVTFASPLVDINRDSVIAVHGSQFVGTRYSISEIPLDSSHEVMRSLMEKWTEAPVEVNRAELKDACDPGQDRTEIFILSRPAFPYLPMVFESLNEPIRNQWQEAVSSGDSSSFWTWRRARTLRHFIPISKKHLAAFMQGWVAGRISGDIQLDDSGEKSGSKVVKVRDPKTGKWVHFPKNLLGVSSLGVSRQSHGGDESGWNVPPALLESLPLAMSQTQGLDISSLDPYVAVMDLGYSLKTPEFGNSPSGGPQEVLNVLDDWYNTGGSSGFESQITAARGSDKSTRKANAIAWLEQVIKRMNLLIEQGVSEERFDEINREFELAPEAIEACEVVLRELDRIDLGSAKASEGSTPRSPDTDGATGEELPKVEG